MVGLESNILELERVMQIIAGNKSLKSTLSRSLYLLGIFCFAMGFIVDKIEPAESAKYVEDNDESAAPNNKDDIVLEE